VALLISWLLLHEQPAPQALLGGAVVISSVALVNLRRRPLAKD
jgi:drug/metabolite transporter (DMT)-like permease